MSARQITYWLTAALCFVLLAGSASELWVRHGVQGQYQNVQQQNTRLRNDIQATRHAISVAQNPTTIQRKAQQWGYVQSGG